MIECPYCGKQTETTVIKSTHTHVEVGLSCGHTATRNPDMGLPLSYSTEEIYDPTTKNMVKRRVATIDSRELIKLEELNTVTSPVNPDAKDVGRISQPAPKREEVAVEAFEEADEPETKRAGR